MKLLILFPLTVLILLSLLSMLGLGSATDPNFGNGTIGYGFGSTLFYDSTGHPVAYANGTNYGEKGLLKIVGSQGWFSQGTEEVQWINNTAYNVMHYYDIYTDTNGQSLVSVEEYNYYKDNADGQFSFNIWSSLGLIGVIVGIAALAAIIGIRIVSSGESDVSVQVILVITAFMALWGIFSVLGLTLLTSAGTYGGIIYFILTAMYTIGIIFEFGR